DPHHLRRARPARPSEYTPVTDHDHEQRIREVLNTLATLPPHSTATLLGVRVERIVAGYRVEGHDDSYHPQGAAKLIVEAHDRRAPRPPAGPGAAAPPPPPSGGGRARARTPSSSAGCPRKGSAGGDRPRRHGRPAADRLTDRPRGERGLEVPDPSPDP